jgi:tol-pal system protein YbgF
MQPKISLVLILAIALSVTACFRSRADIAREKEEKEVRSALQQNIVSYNQQIERLQADLGRLQGRIEELEHQRRKEMSGLQTRGEGNEKSVAELRAQISTMQQQQATLFEEIKKLKEENLQLLKAASERPSASRAAPAQKKKGGGASYSGSLKLFKAKKFEAAADGFRAYIEAYPRGKHAIDARYYLGESLYRQKAYTEAIVEYGAVHEKSPTSSLGRKSTLRLAESFRALGKSKDAKAFAEILVQTSPKSAEAKQARKFLQ